MTGNSAIFARLCSNAVMTITLMLVVSACHHKPGPQENTIDPGKIAAVRAARIPCHRLSPSASRTSTPPQSVNPQAAAARHCLPSPERAPPE